MTLTQKILARHSGLDSVFDNEKIVLVLDHFVPNKDIQSAAQCAEVRAFAKSTASSIFMMWGFWAFWQRARFACPLPTATL